jgi:hypothetical protein
VRILLLGILFAALLPAFGCGGSERERGNILQILATRAGSLNSRDMSQYLSVVSTRYSDKGKDFARLRADLEKNFREFEQITYESERPSVTVEGDRAGAVGSYRMKVRVRGREMSLNGTEHIRLVKEPEGWKIVAGI